MFRRNRPAGNRAGAMLAAALGLFAIGAAPMASTAREPVVAGSEPMAAAAPQTLTALAGLEKGKWHLRDLNGDASRDICVRNVSALVQLRHGGAQCSHFVIENTDRKATVHYTCPGHGHGRTTITVETPRLLQLQTQGVLDGSPFSSDFEGRRIGACQ
ncbi:DUF3617 domain-containing protein [Stakelama tenebrarum]|uniref:DUF3617 domain-containing protein n=1 Tax=Stakelama tenebrarum TaxID=2711215 RepID=A0A6G6Y2G6_9SPHN|nr:hypothetical protein [Sphingosinithalassobacter tenebrarum]QIG79115.1 hypothetical protein G5C33_04480 [Sphingosinithalassobacter tenebrarum]